MHKILTILMILVTFVATAQVTQYAEVGQYVIHTLGTTDYEFQVDSRTGIGSAYGAVIADTIFKVPSTTSSDTIATLLTAMNGLSGEKVLAIERGGEHRVQVTIPDDSITVCSYGTGAKPIITAFDTTAWNFYKTISGADSYVNFTNGALPSGWSATSTTPTIMDFADETMGIEGFNLKCIGGSNRQFINTALYEDGTDLYIDFAYRIGSDLSGGNDLLVSYNNSDFQPLLKITDNGDGTWNLLAGDDTGLIDTEIDLDEDTNYNIAFHFKANATTGGVRVWYKEYDGTPINTSTTPDYSKQDHDTSTELIDEFRMGNSGVTSGSTYFDEIIVSDTGFVASTLVPNIYIAGVSGAVYIDTLSLGTRVYAIVDLDTQDEWYFDASLILQYSSTSPAGIEYSVRDMSLSVDNVNYITLNNLNLIGNGENGNYGAVLRVSNSDYTTITNCTVEQAITGFSSGSDGSGIVINSADYAIINNCDIKDNANDGVWFVDSHNCKIYDCIMSGNGFGTGDENNVGVWNSANTHIYNNTLTYTGPDDNLEIVTDDNTTIGCKVYNNIIDNSGADATSNGILVGNGSRAEIYYNEFLGNSSAHGLMIASTNTLDSVLVYNNTFEDWLITLRIYDEGSVNVNSYFVVKNNISANIDNYHTEIGSFIASGTTVIMDNNLYDDDTGTLFKWNESSYNFADWKTNSSQDANSPIPDDALFATDFTDLSLQTGSPAINAGVDVGLTTDILGNPIVGLPDIGAYEKQ